MPDITRLHTFMIGLFSALVLIGILDRIFLHHVPTTISGEYFGEVSDGYFGNGYPDNPVVYDSSKGVDI